MSSSLGIEKIEYYLPEKTITSQEMSDKFGFPLDFVEQKIGVTKIFQTAPEELSSDLGVKAFNKLEGKVPDLKNELDVLIVCTQTPDYSLPHTAAVIHQKLGLNESVATFDFSLGCSGFVYGLSIIESFMKNNDFKKGVLITAETYSKLISEKDKSTKPLFSDAGSATLIGTNPILTSGKFSFGTSGNGFDKLIVEREDSRSPLGKSNHLVMNGRGIFEFGASKIPEEVKNCLKGNKIDIEEIDSFVFHQASTYMLQAIQKYCRIKDSSKVVNLIAQFGNTVSSSIPIALKANQFKTSDKKLLICGFGVGLSYSSTILNIVGDINEL